MRRRPAEGRRRKRKKPCSAVVVKGQASITEYRNVLSDRSARHDFHQKSLVLHSRVTAMRRRAGVRKTFPAPPDRVNLFCSKKSGDAPPASSTSMSMALAGAPVAAPVRSNRYEFKALPSLMMDARHACIGVIDGIP